MKHCVHVFPLVEGIEKRTGDVEDSFSDNPTDGGSTRRFEQGFESYEHREAHTDEAERFEITVVFEFMEGDERTRDGARPHEDEQAPSPTAIAQRNERDGRIGAGDVPVDSGMVPLAQARFPLRFGSQRMVSGGGDVGAKHAEEIEAHAERRPAVMLAEAPCEEYCAEDNAHDNASGMTPRVPELFLM